ncbi:MAG: class I SAM-dependent methyltransferase [Sphingomonadales bacterium]|nr:class I SAM-dependent methyltransferase [Sphingomonadales bacterium]MDE2568679.1 class I SAM-dependent methyltransferase [Sphingomonadales bacterium]
MDAQYRFQRHFYDLTRKYYLFGRDRLIRELDCKPDDKVLEIGCGTGRNLVRVAKAWPEVTLHGLDISSEMLKSARATLGHGALLAQGDATSFDAVALFGAAQFDRVFISFAVSMIPDWKRAIDHAAMLVAPGGTLAVVDFGDMRGLWSPIRASLRGWLRKFHVTPRTELPDVAASAARRHKLKLKTRRGPFGYFALIRLTRT